MLCEAMDMVYEDISKLHHTVAPILTIQTHTKERVAMLKEVITTPNSIHVQSIKYLGAPVVVLKKDWITMQNSKVQLCIKIHSKEKLAKYVDRALGSYKHLFNGLESMIEVHGVPSIGEVRHVRKK